ncbi:MAG: hypothetical protein ACEPOW_13740 [Bacteroidales bacterium]
MEKKRKVTYYEDDRTINFSVDQRVCRGKTTISTIEKVEHDDRSVAKIYVKDDSNSETLWKEVNLPNSSNWSFENDFTQVIDS